MLIDRAKGFGGSVVLPEGQDPRVMKAAAVVLSAAAAGVAVGALAVGDEVRLPHDRVDAFIAFGVPVLEGTPRDILEIDHAHYVVEVVADHRDAAEP